MVGKVIKFIIFIGYDLKKRENSFIFNFYVLNCMSVLLDFVWVIYLFCKLLWIGEGVLWLVKFDDDFFLGGGVSWLIVYIDIEIYGKRRIIFLAIKVKLG